MHRWLERTAQVAAVVAALVAVAPATTWAADPIEGTWGYGNNGGGTGEIRIARTASGAYAGTVVEEVRFHNEYSQMFASRCIHPPGEEIWTLSGSGESFTGSYNGFGQFTGGYNQGIDCGVRQQYPATWKLQQDRLGPGKDVLMFTPSTGSFGPSFAQLERVQTAPPPSAAIKHDWDVAGRRVAPDRGGGIVSTIHGSGFAKVSELQPDSQFGGSIGKATTGGAIILADRRGNRRKRIPMVVTRRGAYGEDYRADGTTVGGRAVFLNVVTRSCPNGKRRRGDIYMQDDVLRKNPANDDDRESYIDIRICGLRRVYTQTATNPLIILID